MVTLLMYQKENAEYVMCTMILVQNLVVPQLLNQAHQVLVNGVGFNDFRFHILFSYHLNCTYIKQICKYFSYPTSLKLISLSFVH